MIFDLTSFSSTAKPQNIKPQNVKVRLNLDRLLHFTFRVLLFCGSGVKFIDYPDKNYIL